MLCNWNFPVHFSASFSFSPWKCSEIIAICIYKTKMSSIITYYITISLKVHYDRLLIPLVKESILFPAYLSTRTESGASKFTGHKNYNIIFTRHMFSKPYSPKCFAMIPTVCKQSA